MYNHRPIEGVDLTICAADRGHAGVGRDEDVRCSNRVDENRLIDVVRSAFRGDPAARWMYPDAGQYEAHFPDFVTAVGGRAFVHGAAHVLGDFVGASLWLPPGVHTDDDAVLAHIRRNAPRRIWGTFLPLFGQLARRRPVVPHWHLALMGVHPGHRRRGYGAHLLKHSVRICDDEGFPAYVEVWNAESIGFYQRAGFEVLTTVQIGSSPAVTPMLRRPLTDFKNLIPEGRIDLKP